MKAEYWGSNKFAPQGIFNSGCGETEWQGCEYGATSKAIDDAIKVHFEE